MNCYYCGASLEHSDYCPECDADVRIWKKIYSISNRLYNEGLRKAQVRDLSGAADYLRMSLRYNKMNINARNLLGLVYYERGETGRAIGEWAISQSLLTEDNPAAGYLRELQKNTAQLDTANQTIRKFNQALTYCKSGSEDLAVLQLKKVLSLNSRLVQAHQLLALLYMKQERYDLALRTLNYAARIDAGDTDTQRYLAECRSHLEAGSRQPAAEKEKQAETVTYRSGNDFIIRPAKLADHSALVTVVNLLVGAAIGIAVVCFLIIPEIRHNANSAASSQVVEANETISAREQTIQSLEDQITALNSEVDSAKAASESAQQEITSYEQLLDAYVSYSTQDLTTAKTSLESVNADLLGDNAKTVYNQVYAQVESETLTANMNSAIQAYESGDYDTAIELLGGLVELDQSYQNGKAVYYLAYSYYKKGDQDNALKWFRVAEETVTTSKWRRTSKKLADQLESSGATIPGEDTADTSSEE